MAQPPGKGTSAVPSRARRDRRRKEARILRTNPWEGLSLEAASVDVKPALLVDPHADPKLPQDVAHGDDIRVPRDVFEDALPIGQGRGDQDSEGAVLRSLDEYVTVEDGCPHGSLVWTSFNLPAPYPAPGINRRC